MSERGRIKNRTVLFQTLLNDCKHFIVHSHSFFLCVAVTIPYFADSLRASFFLLMQIIWVVSSIGLVSRWKLIMKRLTLARCSNGELAQDANEKIKEIEIERVCKCETFGLLSPCNRRRCMFYRKVIIW